MRFDVAVVGVGGMGSAALAHCAARGASVIGIEQFGIAHDLGSSHGKSRMIRKAYFENPAYVPLILRAYELWRELERDAGEELLRITGVLAVGAREQHDCRADAAHRDGARLAARAVEQTRDRSALSDIEAASWRSWCVRAGRRGAGSGARDRRAHARGASSEAHSCAATWRCKAGIRVPGGFEIHLTDGSRIESGRARAHDWAVVQVDAGDVGRADRCAAQRAGLVHAEHRCVQRRPRSPAFSSIVPGCSRRSTASRISAPD